MSSHPGSNNAIVGNSQQINNNNNDNQYFDPSGSKAATTTTITNIQIIESFRIMDILLQFFLAKEFSTISSLVESGKVNVNVQNQDGLSLLHLSVSQNNLEFSRYLISKGANVNIMDISQITPLHNACANGSLPLVELLVRSGANINTCDEEGDSPCHYAIRESQDQVLEFLINQCKANVNASNDEGESLLHLACGLGELKSTQVLLRAGAQINLRDECGQTPLCEAKNNNHCQIVDLLSQFSSNNKQQQQQQQQNEHTSQFPFQDYKDMHYGSTPIYASYYF
ncbi:ankyrin repeat-containing protein [Tieghemostelium lacteum]|uniref:Ankyrin repeat-containing protein n=1 Tax=Tieghemostelium lacteum TaxID=361077 RepID=A0A152A1C5_TIELA|nr:ankyrin repeat-containing protein [Tieghemostelium lacteum]|eukprot:KYR00048.1 ankyrin repeat-containing protein [Tieghemostelium lacteum]